MTGPHDDSSLPTPQTPPAPRLRLRVVFDADRMMGPGKADLLALIRDTGSISAAGREMGMSYKRAWTLVEEMNAMFHGPLVTSTRGGAKGGGASLTEVGESVLHQYRALEDAANRGGAAELDALQALLADETDMSK